MTERQRKYAKYAEKLGKVHEVSHQLNHCHMVLNQTLESMETLNNLLHRTSASNLLSGPQVKCEKNRAFIDYLFFKLCRTLLNIFIIYSLIFLVFFCFFFVDFSAFLAISQFTILYIFN